MMPSLLKYFTIVGGLLFAGLIALNAVLEPGGPGPKLVNEPKVTIRHDPRASLVERLRAEEAAQAAAKAKAEQAVAAAQPPAPKPTIQAAAPKPAMQVAAAQPAAPQLAPVATATPQPLTPQPVAQAAAQPAPAASPPAPAAENERLSSPAALT